MMKLGLFLHGPGQHIAAWRDPASDPGAGMSLRHYVHLTQLGERALFDFVFNADTQATFGPDDVEVWKRNTVAHRSDQRMGRAEVDADGDPPLVRVGRLAGLGNLQQGHQ